MTVENKEIGASPIPAELQESTKTAEESPAMKLIDKRREDAENAAIEENTTHSKAAIEQLLDTGDKAKAEDVKSEKPEDKKEEVQEIDPIDRVKSKVQKRIDKEVAKRKTVEEQLEDTRRELEEIRAKQNQQVIGNKDDAKSTEPTMEQIDAYIEKMAAEGNLVELARAQKYQFQRIADEKEKSAMEKINSRERKTTEAQQKQLQDWNALQNDYVVRDEAGKIVHDDDMNLSNQKGMLYRTAMSLYHDKELHARDYSDPDKVMGFRRAVADAFREIYQGGLNRKETLTVEDAPKPKRRQVLVEPSSDGAEETREVSPSRSLSDNDKVMDEIMSRRKYQAARVPVRQ